MSELSEKLAALRLTSAKLAERIHNEPNNGPPEAQAARLIAATILQSCGLPQIFEHVEKAIEFPELDAEIRAQEPYLEGNATAALMRYGARLMGKPQPVYTRADLERQWILMTNCEPASIEPFHSYVIATLLPIAETMVQQAEAKLAEADRLTAAQQS